MDTGNPKNYMEEDVKYIYFNGQLRTVTKPELG